MTIQQCWTVELDQGNVVVDKRWVIIPSMLNDFGRVADLFCAVGVKTVPFSRADAIVGDVQFVTYTVRSQFSSKVRVIERGATLWNSTCSIAFMENRFVISA